MMIRVAIVSTVLAVVPVSLHYVVRGADSVDRAATSYVSNTASDALNRIAGALGYSKPVELEQYTAEDLAEKEALIAGINPALVRSIMHVESRGNEFAESPKGARGLLQVMPFNYKRCGLEHHSQLWEPHMNIRCGVQILAEELKTTGGDIVRALSRYNGGGACDFDRCPQAKKYARDVMARLARDIR